MAEPLRMELGCMIQIGEVDYRVISLFEEGTILCKLNTGKLELSYWTLKKLFSLIEKGEAVIDHDTEHVVDEEQLSDRARKDFLYKKEIMQRIVEVYGPEFIQLQGRGPIPVIDEIVKENILSRSTIRRLIVRYLQSGLKDYSLVDRRAFRRSGEINAYKKRTGRAATTGTGIPLTEEVLRHFDEALQEYKSHNNKDAIETIEVAYLHMLDRHYSEVRYLEDGSVERHILPKDQRPTLRQFRYYVNKALSEEEKRTIQTSAREYRNNERIRLGSSETNVTDAYDMIEMDAVEFKVSLVDEEGRLLTVGKPIIYLMKDVATRMILAASIGFDNNSIVGCTNCFANLNEDKQALCEQYGIKLEDPRLWLTGYKPRRMRFDNGSDFISKRVEEICRDLNIQRDLTPPAGGSFKGVIERSFLDAHQKLDNAFRGYGHISTAHDSHHHEEATLSIFEFTKIFYAYVLSYNNSLNEGLTLTKNMIEQDIPQVPWKVMQYYLNMHKPQMLPFGDEYLKVLLIPAKASLSGDGITVNKLNYLNMGDEDLVEEMRRLNRKRKSFPVLYDPRSINKIYYLKEHQLLRASLNLNHGKQRSYQNMTLAQVNDLFKKAKETREEAREESLQNRVDAMRVNNKVVQDAKEKKGKGKTDTKNMRQNREDEKQSHSYEQTLEGRIGDAALLPPQDEALDSERALEKKPVTEKIPMSLEERKKQLLELSMANLEE